MNNSLVSAFRQLRRSPSFALTVVLILAFGIGVTTAIYSILYAVVLRPLPFPHPEQLVGLTATPWRSFSIPTMLDWQRRTNAFQSMAAYSEWSPRIESSAGIGGVNASLISGNLLSTLGASFTLGHDLTQTGAGYDCLHQAIVTTPYWKRLGGSSLSGQTLQIDHETYAIVGVLAPLEIGGDWDGPAVLTSLGCDKNKSATDRGDSAFQGIARLKPGVTLAEASAQLQSSQQHLAHDQPRYYPPSFRPVLSSYTDLLVGTSTKSALLATFTACCTLLLISCANLANLLLARNTRRRAEFAIRSTLGATPRHLVVQLLTENCVLALTGATLGMALAHVLLQSARGIHMVHLPRLEQATINLPVFFFTALTTLTVAVVITLLPAIRSTRPALLADISSGSSRSSATRGLHRTGRLLVASQIALAVILVASAGWMVSSVYILLHQPLGFTPDRLLFVSTDLRGPARDLNSSPERTLAILQQTEDKLRILPGVVEVAAANDKPLGGRINRYNFCSDVHPGACRQPPNLQAPDNFQVTPGYFHAMGQELYRGRDFNMADNGRDHVVIVNRALANQEWPGQNPIGHRIYSGQLKSWANVVGEVGDVHSYSLERAPVPNLYIPEMDGPDVRMTLMVRTAEDPGNLEETVRHTLRQEGRISVRYVESMPEMMEHQVALRRFSMQVAVLFGMLALGLAIFGTYGLLAYEVSLREREIGIRLALGSTRSAIISLLVRQESRWIASGVGTGLCGAVAVGLLLRSQFFHTRAASVPVLTATSLLLAVPALLAVIVPSRRVSLLEPSIVLRRD